MCYRDDVVNSIRATLCTDVAQRKAIRMLIFVQRMVRADADLVQGMSILFLLPRADSVRIQRTLVPLLLPVQLLVPVDAALVQRMPVVPPLLVVQLLARARARSAAVRRTPILSFPPVCLPVRAHSA